MTKAFGAAARRGIDPAPLRDWTTVHQAELEDQARFVNSYPVAKRRRLNYTNIVLAFVLVYWAVAIWLEAR